MFNDRSTTTTLLSTRRSGKPRDMVAPGPDDAQLRRILLDAHLVLCDGTPLVWASRWLGNPLPERIAGSDLVPLLLAEAERRGWRVFFLGGTDESVARAARIASTGVLALRFRGQKSWGKNPDFVYFGGNSEMRGYDYLSFVGQNAMFANAELRFPLIEAALTPIGVIGGIRGVFFANIGGGWFNNSGFKFYSNKAEQVTTITGYQSDALGNVLYDPTTNLPVPIYSDPKTISGFRLRDGRASYGLGLETFALGFPIHFDWSWRTLFNKDWEDVTFASSGGSAAFRKPRFAMWIGYDF